MQFAERSKVIQKDTSMKSISDVIALPGKCY